MVQTPYEESDLVCSHKSDLCHLEAKKINNLDQFSSNVSVAKLLARSVVTALINATPCSATHVPVESVLGWCCWLLWCTPVVSNPLAFVTSINRGRAGCCSYILHMCDVQKPLTYLEWLFPQSFSWVSNLIYASMLATAVARGIMFSGRPSVLFLWTQYLKKANFFKLGTNVHIRSWLDFGRQMSKIKVIVILSMWIQGGIRNQNNFFSFCK